MSRSLRRHLPPLLAATLAGSGAVAALALPAPAGAATTIKTRTSTTTIYGNPPAGVTPGARGGPVAPSDVPTTGRIRVPKISTHVRAPGATHPPSTRAASPTQGAKTPGAGAAGGTPPTASGPAAKAPPAPATTTTPPAASVTRPAAPATAHRSSGLSAGAILLAVLAGLLVLACAAWLLARALAFEPHWTLSARHALSEASFRASATWDEFGDWMRLGH